MTTTEQQTVRRVTSRDGTEIARWSSGDGPALVLVHGATADHTRWRPLLDHLEPHVTVHAIDRRGRGGSGDGPDYAPEREFEDVAAVVDAVAAETGGPVDLLGHSFGGLCTLQGALLTSNVRKLVLYEPPVDAEGHALPPDLLARMESLLDEGRREEVLLTMFREVVRMPEHELEPYRALPAWQARIAAAHTVTRELRAVDSGLFDLGQAARITVPTLLLLGGDSPDPVRRETEALADALPDARVVVLAGQQHVAIDLVPEEFAGHVLAFLQERPGT